MKSINEYLLFEARKLKREELKDIKAWIDDKSKIGNKLSENDLKDLENKIKEYFVNGVDYSHLSLGFSDKDLICDIAGYIIEAAVYDAIKQIKNVTSRSSKGLKFDNESVYWDFAINGLDEKFDIKAICKNGYHTGGISKSENQKNDEDLIYIIIPYKASDTGFEILTNKISVKKYK